MANSTFRTEIFGTSVEMIADWSQSSSSIWMKFGDSESYCTGQQVADFGHQKDKAMRHFLEEYVSEGGDDPEDFEDEIAAAIEAMADDCRGDMDDAELLDDLGDIRDLRVDHRRDMQWIDDVGTVWNLPCKAHVVDDDSQNRIVMWTDTDEAGVQDVTVESGFFPDSQMFVYWARGMADDLGTRFDGVNCPDCRKKITWGSIQTGRTSGNFCEGSCGCSGRTWTETERGSDWIIGYDQSTEGEDE